MVKFVKYGLFIMGVVLCFYTPVSYMTETRKEMVYEADVLGMIEIPAIQLKLPIYQGTEVEVLSKGIGHIEQSSPLVGGETSHCLLAGHRGLPGAEMFLRLNELVEGDIFVIEVPKQKLVYKVCKIQVILPEETEALQIQAGKNLFSLITCTPYGIHTHRLVVTGERMVNDGTIY